MSNPSITGRDVDGNPLPLNINGGTVTEDGQFEGTTDTTSGGASLAEVAARSPNAGGTYNLPADSQWERPVEIPPEGTLEVYRWGAKLVSDGSVPAGLEMRILDDSDTVQVSAETRLNQSTDSPVATLENTSTTDTITAKIQAHNGTGSDIGVDNDAEGVATEAGYLVV
jgi:hypothetical protein